MNPRIISFSPAMRSKPWTHASALWILRETQNSCVISAGIKFVHANWSNLEVIFFAVAGWWLRPGRIHVYRFQPGLMRNLNHPAVRRTSEKCEAVLYLSHWVLPGGWGSQPAVPLSQGVWCFLHFFLLPSYGCCLAGNPKTLVWTLNQAWSHSDKVNARIEVTHFSV